MAASNTSPPPLVSEHGKAVVVKQHTRAAPSKKLVVNVPPAATGLPPKTVVPPAVNPVDAAVTAAQLPATQQINSASAASALAAKNAATTTQGYYQALAEALQNIGPAVQSGYASAGANDAAFGKGFSDGLAHVQSQAQDQATNLAGISGGAAGPPVAPAAADALYNVGGYIPASTMTREGAAFGAAADQLPFTAAGQGASTIKQIGAQQVVDQQGFTKQLSDLAAQAPGLRAQYQAAADAQANTVAQQKQAALNEANKEADTRRQQQISYILATGIGPDGKLTAKAAIDLARVTGYYNGKPTAATVNAQGRLAVAQVNASNAAARLTVAQQKAFSDMYGHDENGNLTLPGQKAALAQWKATHAGTKGAFTKQQVYKIKSTAATQAHDFFNGKTKVVMVSGSPQTVTVQNPEPNYQAALRQMVTAGVPLTIAQTALNAYWPLGNADKGKTDANGGPLPYGRPYLSLQQRAALTSAWPGHTVDPFAVPTTEEVLLLKEHGVAYSGPVNKNSVVPYPPPPK